MFARPCEPTRNIDSGIRKQGSGGRDQDSGQVRQVNEFLGGGWIVGVEGGMGFGVSVRTAVPERRRRAVWSD